MYNMKWLFTLLVSISLVACTKKEAVVQPVSNPPINTNTTTKTWLALGDSYTIGQSVDAAERFPTQTANWLLTNGISMAIPDYIAVTGWTTINLQNGIQSTNPAQYDVVSLLIGVNDQYQTHDTTGYRLRFTQLLQKAIQLAKGKKENVFVLSIPDYSVTPFAIYQDTARIRMEIDWFNAINKNVTANFQCAYLDITPSTREGRYDRTLIASDGLHPSALEYRRWANKLGPLVYPALR